MISEHASPLAACGDVDAGGQNVYVAQLARRLAQRGHVVHVFTRRDAPEPPDVVPLAPRLKVIHVPAGPPVHVPKERLLPLMAGFAEQLQRHVRAHGRYDVVHANFFMSGLAGLHLKEAFGTPLVTTFHALGLVRQRHQGAGDGFPAERIAIERLLARESDAIVAECPQDALDLRELYGARPERMVMIPCGVDPVHFRPIAPADARRALGLDDTFTVLQLGRMVPRKGVDNVIRAVARLRRRFGGSVRLRIVGGASEQPETDGSPELARLAELARAERVDDCVQFVGRRAQRVLPLHYAASDVFVTTPWYEPFGITPLEAMACARPVVGSAVGGIRWSVLDGVTGFLVPPDDPDALAERLAWLRADAEAGRRLGAAGLRRVKQLFTWSRVAAQVEAAYFAVRASGRQAAEPRWLAS